ncbi:MAG: hypothetical protein WKF57_07950 [Nakamurella sp.]
MSQPVDPPPLSFPPPPPVRLAAAAVLIEGLGVTVFGVLAGVSGIRDGHPGPALAQMAYFLALALFLAAVGVALLRGRRWGRTPAIVIQILAGAIGGWLAIPGEHLGWGIALALIAVLVGYLLLSPPATVWMSQFPALFGPDAPDPTPPNATGTPGSTRRR